MISQSAAGIALFDDHVKRDAGWCSINGEPSIPISSAQELSSGAVWILNLADSAYKASGLGASRRFRPNDYLRVPLGALARELGVAVQQGSVSGAAGATAARTLSRLFSAVMNISSRLGVPDFPAYQLRLAYRLAHAPEDPLVEMPADCTNAFADAMQRYTMSERRKQQRAGFYEEVTSTFTRHRYNHAIEVLAQYVPEGRWRTLPMMAPRDIVSHPRPLLIDAEVHTVGAPLGHLVNFGGSSTSPSSGQPRRWLTQPEYAFLEPFSEISIRKILECEAYVENPLYRSLPRLTPIQEMSPATLLCLENLWTSIYRLPNGRPSMSAAAAWASAHDRIICAREAMQIIERDPDADIASYGFGKVVVKTMDHGVNEGLWLRMITEKTLLLPPAATVAPHSYDSGDSAGPAEIMQNALIGGRPDVLLDLDDEAIVQFDEFFPVDEEGEDSDGD